MINTVATITSSNIFHNTESPRKTSEGIVVIKAIGIKTLKKILKEKVKKNFGILIALHDLNLAYNFADKILLLKNGELAKYGTPDDVFIEKNLSYVYEIPIVAYCAHEKCNASELAIKELMKKGFVNINEYSGGIVEYRKMIPVDR